MVKYAFRMFGQQGKGRIIRPVHICASNARGWTLCNRATITSVDVNYDNFDKPLANALVAAFTCKHCEGHAIALGLERVDTKTQPEMMSTLQVVEIKQRVPRRKRA